jgi:hypothetical protein
MFDERFDAAAKRRLALALGGTEGENFHALLAQAERCVACPSSDVHPAIGWRDSKALSNPIDAGFEVDTTNDKMIHQRTSPVHRESLAIGKLWMRGRTVKATTLFGDDLPFGMWWADR